MKSIFLLILAALPYSTLHAQHKANAQWLSESQEITANSPLKTVIRMTIDDGWHTYWKNPGEGGMELELKTDLPDGWSLGELQYPAPTRFKTGSLPSFGYKGQVLFPVTITPPAGATGKIPELKASLYWLTCDNEVCLAGNTELTLDSVNPDLVTSAYQALPQDIQGAELQITPEEKHLTFTLTLPDNSEIDPSTCQVYPLTTHLVDPGAIMKFTKDPKTAGQWLCKTEKNEYFSKLPSQSTLILVDSELHAWKITSK